MIREEEARKKAEEFIDNLKQAWREGGWPCEGWDEGEVREALIENMVEAIKKSYEIGG